MVDAFLPGLCVGFIQSIVGHPLDTLKTWKQNVNLVKTPKLSIKNIYAGFTYPLISSLLLNSCLFTTFKYLRNEIKFNNFTSGFISGGLCSIILNPFELYKIQRQQKVKFILNPLYGIRCTFIRECIGNAIYFDIYYRLYNYNISIFVAGGLAGFSSWLITYPIDTIKTRIQAGISLTIKEAYLAKNLWRGFSYCGTRSFIVNAIGFETYEFVSEYINK